MRWHKSARAATLVALGVCAAAAPVASARPETAADDERPNVLVIMTDDQALKDVDQMPNVRRLLGRRGTTFTNAISSFPLCCPARATFLTGQFAHNHGVSGNFAPEGYYGLRKRSNLLPTWLQKSGYHTAMIGKYLNGYGARDPKEVPPGYTEWWGALDFSSYDYFNFTLNHNGKLKTWGDADYAARLIRLAGIVERNEIHNIQQFVQTLVSVFVQGEFGTKRAKDYSNDVTARITDGILKRQAKSQKPFFVWWAPAAPHREDVNSQRGAKWADPRPAPRHESLMSRYKLAKPPSFNEADASDKPKYIRELPPLSEAQVATLERNHGARVASLQSVDEGVAKLVKTLKATGQYDNTVIVFTSDNGWIEGQHRIPGDKYVPYEESVRVPLIVSGPGFPAGRKVNAQVSNADFAPTFLDLADAKAGRRLDGLSLVPFAARPSRAPDRALPIEATGKLFVAEGFPQDWDRAYSGVRSDDWKYVRWSYGDEELYDLRADPRELVNLAADAAHAADLAQMRAAEAELRRCRGNGCNTVEP